MRHLTTLLSLLTLLAAPALAGCGGDLNILADPEPLQDVLGASAPIAWSAALAMSAIGGDIASCVEPLAGCAGDDCIAAMSIDAGDPACFFPFAGEVTGTIDLRTRGPASASATWQAQLSWELFYY